MTRCGHGLYVVLDGAVEMARYALTLRDVVSRFGEIRIYETRAELLALSVDSESGVP